ncbi:hypothetical protein G7Z17_g10591 [Cylindrodendrum hubeiense]|uniref:PNPLA domain-containing protein n=1 Tax=Cylindrodendrum hubeiense TaxID=595255 RepID=A0A9P5H2P7_9HYPO|nr:hypothetical protein G7Z17_g10591 [Cylindrodendrum hubeiense]
METDHRHLRILSLDGGGTKGYTSLLILKRILQTIMIQHCLPKEPLPCEVFDFIAGASTGGLIAIMIGRLRMTIDECLGQYEKIGLRVFGQGRPFRHAARPAVYDIRVLQSEIRRLLVEQGRDEDEMFMEGGQPDCKVRIDGKVDMLRNYMPSHPTQKNKKCTILEAASATAAAPLLFEPVKLPGSSIERYGGGLLQNNPIIETGCEATREMEMEEAWAGREIGCVVSIGAGIASAQSVPSNIGSPLKDIVQIMADSEDTAESFSQSGLGEELKRANRYFRFNMPHDMAMLQMDECQSMERIRIDTMNYLHSSEVQGDIWDCANDLVNYLAST